MSAVASSQTKAVKGSRRPARAWNGAFITCLPLSVDVLQTLGAGRRSRAVEDDCLGGRVGIAEAGAFAPVDQILGVGDHRSDVRVHAAAEVRHGAIVVIRLRRQAPVRAIRNLGAAAADDHPHRAGLQRRRQSPARLAEPSCHTCRRPRQPGRAPHLHRPIDVDRVAVTEAEAAGTSRSRRSGFAGRERPRREQRRRTRSRRWSRPAR